MLSDQMNKIVNDFQPSFLTAERKLNPKQNFISQNLRKLKSQKKIPRIKFSYIHQFFVFSLFKKYKISNVKFIFFFIE